MLLEEKRRSLEYHMFIDREELNIQTEKGCKPDMKDMKDGVGHHYTTCL